MTENIGESRCCCLVQAEGKFNSSFLILASTQYHTALVDNAILCDPPSPPPSQTSASQRSCTSRPSKSSRHATTPARRATSTPPPPPRRPALSMRARAPIAQLLNAQINQLRSCSVALPRTLRAFHFAHSCKCKHLDPNHILS